LDAFAGTVIHRDHTVSEIADFVAIATSLAAAPCARPPARADGAPNCELPLEANMNCIALPRVALRAGGLSCLLMFAAAAGAPYASAQVMIVAIRMAPPALPLYDQPPLPEVGYVWVPGYWAWDERAADYYWVPGTWVAPPTGGLLWTPGYWSCRNDVYSWVPGYWGRRVGFYGGINYGYGYSGVGYQGGQWSGGNFSYNSAVNNFGSVNVANIYEQPVNEDNATVTAISYNGGTGGTAATPNREELDAANERHVMPTQTQLQHQQVASTTPELHASVNHGVPSMGGAAYALDYRKSNKGPITPGRPWQPGGRWPTHGPVGGVAGHTPGTFGPWRPGRPPVTNGLGNQSPSTTWRPPATTWRPPATNGLGNQSPATTWRPPATTWRPPVTNGLGSQSPATTWRPPAGGSFNAAPGRFNSGLGNSGNFSAPNWGRRPTGSFNNGGGASSSRPSSGFSRPSSSGFGSRFTSQRSRGRGRD
jgi:hypothetical protein